MRTPLRSSLVATLALAALGIALPADALQVRSEVSGILIAAADHLPAPRNPQTFEQGHFCANLRIRPRTAEGWHASRLGWTVTSEEQRAGYTAVAIFSRGGQATSGTCLVEDGNVVLYRGGKVVAIVYEARREPNTSGSIGGVVPAHAPDRLRLSDFTPAGFQNADLLLRADAVAVVPVAASETVCGVPVPNLRGMVIPGVRKALAPQKWAAAVNPDSAQERSSDSRLQGFPEIEGCSGTGYGFCLVRYRHPRGAVLEITTTGDEPTVATYGITCPTGRR